MEFLKKIRQSNFNIYLISPFYIHSYTIAYKCPRVREGPETIARASYLLKCAIAECLKSILNIHAEAVCTLIRCNSRPSSSVENKAIKPPCQKLQWRAVHTQLASYIAGYRSVQKVDFTRAVYLAIDNRYRNGGN